jgi:ribosomal protein S27AE
MSFWAEKLSGVATPAPTVVPSRNLYGLYTTPVPQPQTVSYEEDYTPSVRMTKGSTCPGCGSDRYLGSIGDRAVSCGECGYHPRFEQTGYGTRSLPSDAGAATPARQSGDRQTMRTAIAILNQGGGEHL